MRLKLPRILIQVVLISFGLSAEAQIQLHFNNNEQLPAALICPGQKISKNKVPPSPSEEELGLPSLDDISSALVKNPNKTSVNASKLTPIHLINNLQYPIKIGIWGDSHLAANFFSEELIKSTGFSKDEVFPSFFAANIGRAGVRLPLKKTCLGGGWKYSYAYNSPSPNSIVRNGQATIATEFPIGMLRMQAKNKDSYLWLDFRANNSGNAPIQTLEILLAPNGTNDQTILGITVDELQNESFIEIGSEDRIRIDADFPISTVKLRLIHGSLSLDGLIPRYTKQAKLMIDNLAIPGSTFKSWTNLTQPAGFIPSYDLVFLGFGTNEGNNPQFDSSSYQADLQLGLANFRRMYPTTACVLIGPPDRGILVAHKKKLKKGAKPHQAADLLKYAKVHTEIATIQATEANIAGCSFWDWQNAMGGQGSAYTWAYEQPPLMAKDLTHLSLLGYQKSARQLLIDFQLKALLNP